MNDLHWDIEFFGAKHEVCVGGCPVFFCVCVQAEWEQGQRGVTFSLCSETSSQQGREHRPKRISDDEEGDVYCVSPVQNRVRTGFNEVPVGQDEGLLVEFFLCSHGGGERRHSQ